MNDTTPSKDRPARPDPRAERLAAALRANLRRRKAADAPPDDDDGTPPARHPPDSASTA